ncbi:MAG TPA: glucosaminidase domain-containing protein [Bacteroidales bacterium]|nr:glycoside hydrolase [Bacteroidales bacterium]HOU96546.1 glucosaminidase domain-containing protein [Bacteroidales bacterium]HQG37113.1 glucosaminidase domain-containing protein [Bacteroidales bacterium]HQG53613.1 glucosaminidase domain-containing protein [Bacteroidales bacterium]HQJ21143.1 glucosaminidase domain-containing protein [Bacteroidales bacterium]
MRHGFIISLFIFLLIFLFSCRASRVTVSNSPTKPSSESEYIEIYKDLAISEMRRTGIPASITLAQGMVESGNGQSRLALEGNNHFGIKCHNGWTGPTIRHNDDRRNECFRKYRSPEESYRDHSDFLKATPRYSFLFNLDPTDYKAWARGLKEAGYATDPGYDKRLIRKIEEYSLYEYDRQALSDVSGRNENKIINDKTAETIKLQKNTISAKNNSYVFRERSSDRVMENNRIKYIVVNEDDTRQSIEKELNLLKWELSKYNELPPDFTPQPGQILYIQPKRDKAEVGKEYHIVKEGETMYSISQIYGIKLKKLYYMNRMDEGTEPVVGQKLWLRKLMTVY